MNETQYSKVFIDKYFSHTMTGEALKIPRYLDLASVGDEPGMEGDIILDRTTKEFCYHDGQMWHCILVGGEDVTLRNLCLASATNFSLVGGNGIVEQGPSLRIKGLTQGSGILLSNTANCVTISANVSLTNACANAANGNLVVVGTGPALAIKGLLAGQGVTLTTASNCITINANVACITSADSGIVVTSNGNCVQIGSNITLYDACQQGHSLVADGVGPQLGLKGLLEGPRVSIMPVGGNCLLFDTPQITLENACASATFGNLVVDGAGPSLAVKGLIAGNGIGFTSSANCITINNATTMDNFCQDPSSVSLIVSGTPPTYHLKGLVGAAGVELIDGSCITITSNIQLLNACPNAGNGDLVLDGIGPLLKIRGITVGQGLDISLSGNCLFVRNDPVYGRLGNSYSTFVITTSSSAVAMPGFQIGENTTVVSDSIKVNRTADYMIGGFFNFINATLGDLVVFMQLVETTGSTLIEEGYVTKSSGQRGLIHVSTIFPLSFDDEVQMRVFIPSGGPFNLFNVRAVFWVRSIDKS